VSEESLKDILKMRKQILASFKEIGFLFVALDIEGFFSGKLNKALR
jgi:PP-loop superfamily ATP-utilizing enzyme